MTIYHALVLLAVGAFLLGFGAGWHALWLVEPAIRHLRQELRRTREQLQYQHLWNTNLEGAMMLLQKEVRELANPGRDEP